MAEEIQSKDKSLTDEPCVTMLDWLEEEKLREEECQAVLGASDHKCCTYTQGAIKRQALYSCLTCCPEARENLEKCAGICLACSICCHENHELVELYTKRYFRCDCPTKRFAKSSCALNGKLLEAFAANKDNKYNQNFQGLYCTCKRPYPDPERTTEEVMMQCAVCEDWFHLTHLNLNYDATKLSENCEEMMCAGCMQQFDFLNDYRGNSLKLLTIEQEKSDTNMVDVVVDKEEPVAKKAKIDHETETGNKEICCRPKVATTEKETGAVFWGSDWRAVLCKCLECLKMYETQRVEFLLDLEDSAASYEKRAKTETSTYEQGIEALASIGHVQQIDALTEYNHMKDKLKDYLQTFASTNKVVTEQDIARFFEQMRNEKRERITTPNFCR